jgi:hypothetical protein
MSNNTFREPSALKEQDEFVRNAQIFREADRLEQAAYEIIKFGGCEQDLWRRFSLAKEKADAKRGEALQDWLRITNERAKSCPL